MAQTATQTMTPVPKHDNNALLRQIEQFPFLEARLYDTHAYDE